MLRVDDSALREIEEAAQTAAVLSDATALNLVRGMLGGALLHRDAAADRQRGLAVLAELRDTWVRESSFLNWVPFVEVYAAREIARRGDRDGAIRVMRKAVWHRRGHLAWLSRERHIRRRSVLMQKRSLAQPHVADLRQQLKPALTVGRGVPMHQRDTQRELDHAQRVIVA